MERQRKEGEEGGKLGGPSARHTGTEGTVGTVAQRLEAAGQGQQHTDTQGQTRRDRHTGTDT